MERIPKRYVNEIVDSEMQMLGRAVDDRESGDSRLTTEEDLVSCSDSYESSPYPDVPF